MTLLDDAYELDLRALAEYPDVDEPSCQLLGTTGLVVQALLGLFVILSLVYKRHRESPKRPWRIWLFDVSKQVVGQMFVHGANLLVSHLASRRPETDNACVSYFLNILIDTTFGVALIYITLRALTRVFTERLKFEGFESGVYGDPPSFKYWLRQAAVYVMALSTMKVIVIAILVLFPRIYDAGEWLLSWTWTGEGADLQVIFTMGIFPIIMNIIQFWLIDSIVKSSAIIYPPSDLERGPSQEHEPLFNVQLEDDDDDARPTHPPGNVSCSISSLESREAPISRDDKSVATGITTPDDHSAVGSSRQVDMHAYPPSLSSSISSDAPSTYDSKAPKAARNLMKKMQKRETTALTRSKSPLSSPVAPSHIPQSILPEIRSDNNNESQWGDSWGEDSEWMEEIQPLTSKPQLTDGSWTAAPSIIQVER